MSELVIHTWEVAGTEFRLVKRDDLENVYIEHKFPESKKWQLMPVGFIIANEFARVVIENKRLSKKVNGGSQK